MTTRELIYRILQPLKINTEDSSDTYSEEFVYNMLCEKRALVLKQQYNDGRKDPPLSTYQEICIDLIPENVIPGVECTDEILVSEKVLPKLIDFSGDYGISKLLIQTLDRYQIPFSIVPFERLSYLGENKWTKNLVFVAIGYDYRLYFKTNNPFILKLKRVKGYGIFNDPEEALEYSCDETDKPCDIFDSEFPLDESIIDFVIRLVRTELDPTYQINKDLQNDSAEPRRN